MNGFYVANLIDRIYLKIHICPFQQYHKFITNESQAKLGYFSIESICVARTNAHHTSNINKPIISVSVKCSMKSTLQINNICLCLVRHLHKMLVYDAHE